MVALWMLVLSLLSVLWKLARSWVMSALTKQVLQSEMFALASELCWVMCALSNQMFPLGMNSLLRQVSHSLTNHVVPMGISALSNQVVSQVTSALLNIGTRAHIAGG